VPPPSFVGDSKLHDIAESFPRSFANRPIGERMAFISDQFLGTPYVGWTLEQSITRESCFVTLEGLDCVTFFETTLGIARAVRVGPVTPASVLDEVTRTRYRGGHCDGTYLSRLHYTSDWMYDNDLKGTVRVITKSLPGAERFNKSIDFMSTNAKVYRQLAALPDLLKPLKEIEAAISRRQTYFVSMANVTKAEVKLRTGDIIGITTSAPGMDCSHTGIIRMEKGVPHFMHASSTQKRVVLDSRLSEYLARHPKATGIMVARPLEVKR
jgi:hypothetical protein